MAPSEVMEQIEGIWSTLESRSAWSLRTSLSRPQHHVVNRQPRPSSSADAALPSPVHFPSSLSTLSSAVQPATLESLLPCVSNSSDGTTDDIVTEDITATLLPTSSTIPQSVSPTTDRSPTTDSSSVPFLVQPSASPLQETPLGPRVAGTP